MKMNYTRKDVKTEVKQAIKEDRAIDEETVIGYLSDFLKYNTYESTEKELKELRIDEFGLDMTDVTESLVCSCCIGGVCSY